MQSAPCSRDKIKVADAVGSTNHVTFLINRFPKLISLPTSAIFVSGTSGISAILKYRSVNPIGQTEIFAAGDKFSRTNPQQNHTHTHTHIYIFFSNGKLAYGGNKSNLGFSFFNIRVIQIQ